MRPKNQARQADTLAGRMKDVYLMAKNTGDTRKSQPWFYILNHFDRIKITIMGTLETRHSQSVIWYTPSKISIPGLPLKPPLAKTLFS